MSYLLRFDLLLSHFCLGFIWASLFPDFFDGGSAKSFFIFVLAKDFLIGLLIFSFLFFWFPLDLAEFVLVESVEALMMEVAFRVVLANFVEVVHVELSVMGVTCRTKEE